MSKVYYWKSGEKVDESYLEWIGEHVLLRPWEFSKIYRCKAEFVCGLNAALKNRIDYAGNDVFDGMLYIACGTDTVEEEYVFVFNGEDQVTIIPVTGDNNTGILVDLSKYFAGV